MVDKSEPTSFLKAMMTEFKKHGQTTQDFAEEIKRLNDADKAWFREALKAAGWNLI